MRDPVAYHPVFSEDAALFLVNLSRRRQQRLIDLAVKLAHNPFLRSDYSITDESGRDIEHLAVDDFVFAYWVDHASKEVRITDIEDAS